MHLLVHSPPLRVGGSSQNLIPLSSPNKNAEIERAIRTIKEECLKGVLGVSPGAKRVLPASQAGVFRKL